MFNKGTLQIPEQILQDIWLHLFSHSSEVEEAAFVFAMPTVNNSELTFEFKGWTAIKPEEYEEQSPHFLHFGDATRARLIKRAHDLSASLVEFHSHPSQEIAKFSPSDLAGFEEWVPHVRWRLKGRPYAAVVAAPSGLDALVWVDESHKPLELGRIETERRLLRPTGITIRNWERINASRYV